MCSISMDNERCTGSFYGCCKPFYWHANHQPGPLHCPISPFYRSYVLYLANFINMSTTQSLSDIIAFCVYLFSSANFANINTWDGIPRMCKRSCQSFNCKPHAFIVLPIQCEDACCLPQPLLNSGLCRFCQEKTAVFVFLGKNKVFRPKRVELLPGLITARLFWQQ